MRHGDGHRLDAFVQQSCAIFGRRLAADAALLGLAVVHAARFLGEALADILGQRVVAGRAEERDTWLMPERVVRSLGIENKGGVIADIGAGSGYFSRRLAGEVPGGTVYAVDVDDEFRGYIEHNRESWGTPNIEPHLAFYDDPALPEHGIDLVFVSNTYPYLRSRVSYFKKVRSALKPGGRLAVINFKPDADVPDNTAPAPQFRTPRETVITELQAAGIVAKKLAARREYA